LLRQRFAGGVRVVEDIFVGNILSGPKCSTKFDPTQSSANWEVIPHIGANFLAYCWEQIPVHRDHFCEAARNRGTPTSLGNV
jgi:hypothetical protein